MDQNNPLDFDNLLKNQRRKSLEKKFFGTTENKNSSVHIYTSDRRGRYLGIYRKTEIAE
jgi:hypothetical protein